MGVSVKLLSSTDRIHNSAISTVGEREGGGGGGTY